ncbi:hypothetical protein XENOCAPTIV_014002 [Xenoophorus captivus]|uniref:Uncharacterized protein n=1 Tax=Xenoophorus captivus TaxID=1517983 RepID=A0ABV0S6X1_9TELE
MIHTHSHLQAIQITRLKEIGMNMPATSREVGFTPKGQSEPIKLRRGDHKWGTADPEVRSLHQRDISVKIGKEAFFLDLSHNEGTKTTLMKPASLISGVG